MSLGEDELFATGTPVTIHADLLGLRRQVDGLVLELSTVRELCELLVSIAAGETTVIKPGEINVRTVSDPDELRAILGGRLPPDPER